jgi:hypothetical protein
MSITKAQSGIDNLRNEIIENCKESHEYKSRYKEELKD